MRLSFGFLDKSSSWGLLRFAQAQAETSKVPKGRETTDGGGLRLRLSEAKNPR